MLANCVNGGGWYIRRRFKYHYRSRKIQNICQKKKKPKEMQGIIKNDGKAGQSEGSVCVCLSAGGGASCRDVRLAQTVRDVHSLIWPV